MKVKDLIGKLQEENPEMIVVVTGYECGYDELKDVKKVGISKNLKKGDKWWEGEFHEAPISVSDEVALLLPRTS